jgi:hypothetical protein
MVTCACEPNYAGNVNRSIGSRLAQKKTQGPI